MMKAQTSWFVYPEDADTNEIIARFLPAENITEGTMCGDGHRRNLWRCNEYSQVMVLCHNRRQSRLAFKVFKQEGSSPIRPAPEFLTNAYKRKPKVAVKA